MKRAIPLLWLTSCLFAAPAYRGPPSDHFDGRHFFTPNAKQQQPTGVRLLRWLFLREPARWPDWINEPPGAKPLARVGEGELRVTLIGHSSVLIQFDGVNVLTDPVWSERVGPVSWAGPKRHRPPALRFEDLPPIDAVIISHNHYDHMDMPTLVRLARERHPRFFAGLGNRALLLENGITAATDMDWWQRETLSPTVTLVSVPVQHLSMRGLTDRARTLWTGFVLESAHGRVYFGGDSAYGAHFAEARQRLGPMRLALLPVGAYDPRWMMEAVHMDPAQAVQAAIDLGAQASVPIHLQTFQQTDEAYNAPVEALEAALAERDVSKARFQVLHFGEARNF
jgi:L-ascorbate metabolism protein UlaG (beta-lactamase superfamily)